MQATAFSKLYDIIVRLRNPDGCPWDREQTLFSLRGALIEEAYECVDAIDSSDEENMAEELGDVYLVVTMMCRIAEQEDRFTIDHVLSGISEKLVRRHPHVFGEPSGTNVSTSSEVIAQWEKIKEGEKGGLSSEPGDSSGSAEKDQSDGAGDAARQPAPTSDGGSAGDTALNGGNPFENVPNALPPLRKAYEYQKKAAKLGFDWPDIEGVRAKLEEEISELESATDAPGDDVYAGRPRDENAIENEIGDLLFTLVNLARFLNVKPDVALNRTNAKFRKRFIEVKKRMDESGRTMNSDSLIEMERYWQESKKNDNR